MPHDQLVSGSGSRPTVTNREACAAGASGVVMYNQIPLESNRVITSDTTHGAAMLSYSDGAKVLAAMAAGQVTMTFFNDAAVRSETSWSV